MILRFFIAAILGVITVSRAATNNLELAAVTIDAAARSISFAAEVNMRTGLVEYLLVHETGKAHESIFKTAITADKIHVAALLFSDPESKRLRVTAIEVLWKDGGKARSAGAAELIFDKARKRPLRETRWAYRGSRVVDKVFLAQRDGSIIAIMEDRDALIDQETPDAASDENWEPIRERIPALGTPVELKITFGK